MHTYNKPVPEPGKLRSIAEYRFNDALDVVARAEDAAVIGWATWPEVWHLDGDGRFQCCYKASSCDSLKRWARNPAYLRRSRQEGLASPEGCTDRWVIVDSRPRWLNHEPVVDEGDAGAFIGIRRSLRRIGVTLVDAVVFDDEGHWWSMHELTSGATSWRA